jgi:general secretion pathway protein M
LNGWFLKQAHARQVLVATAAVAAVFAAMLAIVVPLHSMRAGLQQGVNTAEGDLQEAKELAARYRSLVAATNRNTSGGSLSTLVNDSLGALPFQPARIQQNGEGTLQVSFDNVEFAAILPWLYQVESMQALNLEVATMSRGVGGTSNVSVVLGTR